ncbi:AMP-binding protein [Billgrantia endophytica]|uniref:2-succinylbenzoate-CoA ligase n=1 Tax=Billgrantia endophytica TaxID=2033802 RepID=A0A2N7U3V8_9GAMM|nr:AMP-binding protein [Halomonas endophytica]PMR75125.1 2-succinylbenzoate-CoA ligase [Halomonas endophytica]
MTEICPIHHWANIAPSRTAIQGPQGSLSYRTLDRRLASLCAQLTASGLTPGDRLMAAARGNLEEVLLAWACLRSGIVFCPLNPAFPPARQATLAKRLDVRTFHVRNGEAPDGNWQTLRLDFSHEAQISQLPALDPARPCDTILTSGSSGQPKAVLHRVGNHLASARGSAELIPLDAECGWLLSLPLFHVGGYAIPFRVFLAGARLVMDDRDRPLAARLESEPITHLSLVPTQLWRLLGESFTPRRTRLRELLLGGAAIPAPLVEKLTALGLAPKVSYGLSEMASQVCSGVPTGPGVVGQPLPGREVRIANGEILVRGDTLFDGYVDGDRLDPARDAEGWFHTRDKGYFTEGGELVVEGRLDHRFISGGENIQPEAIEQRLVDHPGVAQAIVVPIDSEEWGARPVAFVDWHGHPVAGAELATWLREMLPGHMVPDAWLPWPDLGEGLKPSRQALASLASEAASDQPCQSV